MHASDTEDSFSCTHANRERGSPEGAVALQRESPACGLEAGVMYQVLQRAGQTWRRRRKGR